MDVPAILSPQMGSASKGAADSVISDSSRSNDDGFSKHFEKNIDRLNRQSHEPVSSDKHAESTGNTAVVVNKTNAPEAASSSKVVTADETQSEQTATVTEVLSNASGQLHEEVIIVENTAEIPTEVGVILVEPKLETGEAMAAISGNELPPAAALGGPLPLNSDILANANVRDKDIVFDPLTAGRLPDQRGRLNGKGGEVNFLNSSATLPSLNKPQSTSLPDALVGDLKNTVSETVNSMFTQQTAGSKALPATEGLLLNVGAPVAGQTQHAVIDKANLQLDTPMNSQKWGEHFTQRVQWVVGQSMSGAQIRLNPQHMGPIEVRVQMQNDQAMVSFTAQHGATREAIEAALPRLRDMLNEQNVNVVDIDVSQHSFSDQREQASNSQEGGMAQSDEFNRDTGESMFDSQDAEQVRRYTGLFSDFA